MLAEELLKATDEALAIVEGKRPHRGELVQLAIYLYRAWEEGLDYPEQKRVQRALIALQEAIGRRGLEHLDNLAAGEGLRFQNLLNRAIRSIEFAQKLVGLREIRGLTVRDLAARSGVNNSLIYRIQRAIHAPPSPYTLARLAAGLGVRPEELGTPSFPVRSPAQTVLVPTSSPSAAEAAGDEVESRHPLVAELSDYLDRLLRRSYAAVKLESADPALRPLFEDMAARLMKDDAKTRALRVKVLRKVMEATFPILGIVDRWLGEQTERRVRDGR